MLLNTTPEVFTSEKEPDNTFVLPFDHAYFSDGKLRIYGPAAFVSQSIELYFKDKKRERTAKSLSPWNKMLVLIATGFTLDAFDWTEKVLEGITKTYTHLFGAG